MRAALLALLLVPGCVTARFQRRLGFEPIPEPVLADLRGSGADLGTCLARLGAPNLVYEQPDDGLAIAYAWLDQFGWGVDVSISIRWVSVSGDIDRERRNLEGAVLFFDRDLRLIAVDRGLLRDFLRVPARRQPAADA